MILAGTVPSVGIDSHSLAEIELDRQPVGQPGVQGHNAPADQLAVRAEAVEAHPPVPVSEERDLLGEKLVAAALQRRNRVRKAAAGRLVDAHARHRAEGPVERRVPVDSPREGDPEGVRDRRQDVDGLDVLVDDLPCGLARRLHEERHEREVGEALGRGQAAGAPGSEAHTVVRRQDDERTVVQPSAA